MSLALSSILGVAALSGGVAAGASALIALAVVWLVAVALINAIQLLGALLEAVEETDSAHRLGG